MPTTWKSIYLKQLLITQKGDLDFVMNKVMFHRQHALPIIKNEQEKLFIAKSSDTAKIINQIDALNRLYTPMTFTTMLKNIEAPTIILWGAQDQIVNVDVANELKSVLKRPENPIILQRVGHMPLLEAPERVAENYLSFLIKFSLCKIHSLIKNTNNLSLKNETSPRWTINRCSTLTF